MYTIYDFSGRVIDRCNVENGIIDVSALQTGLYLIVVETSSGMNSGKFIKY
jgi:hypothetical protein